MASSVSRLILAASGGLILAACSSRPAPPPAAAPAAVAAPHDSVESVCVRGDTTKLLLRSRANGKRHLQRWLFTSNGAAVDLDTGRQVMDSAQVVRTGIRELFQQEAALSEQESDIARRSGTAPPVEAACR